MKFKFLVIAIFALSFKSISQSIYETNNVVHRLGLHAGTTSGVGLSYKAIIQDKYQIQLTSLPFASETNKTAISGLNLMYKVLNNNTFDVLAVLSVGHYFNSEVYDIYDYNTEVYSTENRTESSLSTSLGVGFEIGSSDRFKFNCQVGYGLYNALDELEWRTLPSVAVGFDLLLSKKKETKK